MKPPKEKNERIAAEPAKETRQDGAVRQVGAVIPNRPSSSTSFSPSIRFVPRKLLPHAVPPWVQPGSLYFFTLCAEPRGTTTLVQPEVATALLSAVRHYHESRHWFARLFLLMPDHLHAIMAFPPAEQMRAVWRDWKRYTAKATRVAWQRDVFEHRLRDDEQWQKKADYIRENPVRQGLVVRAQEWPWVFEA